jgi:hypothetical protein
MSRALTALASIALILPRYPRPGCGRGAASAAPCSPCGGKPSSPVRCRRIRPAQRLHAQTHPGRPQLAPSQRDRSPEPSHPRWRYPGPSPQRRSHPGPAHPSPRLRGGKPREVSRPASSLHEWNLQNPSRLERHLRWHRRQHVLQDHLCRGQPHRDPQLRLVQRHRVFRRLLRQPHLRHPLRLARLLPRAGLPPRSPARPLHLLAPVRAPRQKRRRVLGPRIPSCHRILRSRHADWPER